MGSSTRFVSQGISSRSTTEPDRRGTEPKWSQVVPIDTNGESKDSGEVESGKRNDMGAWCSDPCDYDLNCLVACCCPCAVAGWNWHAAGLGSCASICIPVGILFCSVWLVLLILIVGRTDHQQYP